MARGLSLSVLYLALTDIMSGPSLSLSVMYLARADIMSGPYLALKDTKPLPVSVLGLSSLLVSGMYLALTDTTSLLALPGVKVLVVEVLWSLILVAASFSPSPRSYGAGNGQCWVMQPKSCNVCSDMCVSSTSSEKYRHSCVSCLSPLESLVDTLTGKKPNIRWMPLLVV